jgi:hypothetical protein
MSVTHPPLTESPYYGDPLAERYPHQSTVIYRKLKGEPQLVVVCGECDEIKVIGVAEAMQSALNTFMDMHVKWAHSKRSA